MGWSSGSKVFSEIIQVLLETVENDETRKEIYAGLIEIFENTADCDTLYECKGEDDAFDEVLEEYYPEDDLTDLEEEWVMNPNPYGDED